ncbi:hypothetical protein [Streptomyces sp. NRRL F-5126]|uniref:hypothetical protein n=1 Tax=Streptomyces sp. NRRL F-5126 TaxID=1463857 RepID=UPI0004C58E98|nr:hypothetical protein [Streptomyces sp. NRRL F-5126]
MTAPATAKPHREGLMPRLGGGASPVRTAVCDVRDRDTVRTLFEEAAEATAIGADEFASATDTMFMGPCTRRSKPSTTSGGSPGGGRFGPVGSVGGLLGGSRARCGARAWGSALNDRAATRYKERDPACGRG